MSNPIAIGLANVPCHPDTCPSAGEGTSKEG